MSPSVSLFGKRVLADVIKMRSYWNRVDLGFSKTGNLVKRGKCGHRHTHTQRTPKNGIMLPQDKK